jgi:hypothetical protein
VSSVENFDLSSVSNRHAQGPTDLVLLLVGVKRRRGRMAPLSSPPLPLVSKWIHCLSSHSSSSCQTITRAETSGVENLASRTWTFVGVASRRRHASRTWTFVGVVSR